MSKSLNQAYVCGLNSKICLFMQVLKIPDVAFSVRRA